MRSCWFSWICWWLVGFCHQNYAFVLRFMSPISRFSRVHFQPKCGTVSRNMVPRDSKVGRNKKSKTSPESVYDSSSNKKNRKKLSRNSPGPEPPSLSDSSSEAATAPPIQTLSGGVSLIFSMARRMLLWDEEAYYQQHWNDASPTPDSNSNIPPLPKWHPFEGIADLNPSFRSEAPVMNNQGYAQTIRRNSRKKGKPSLWRYALRTYYKMKDIELEQAEQQARHGNIHRNDHFMIQRQTEHFEAALVACEKLGLFREAMGIYQDIVELEKIASESIPSDSTSTETRILRKSSKSYPDITIKKVRVTPSMIMSLIKSSVRQKDKQERLLSLNTVRDILLSLKQQHGISVRNIMVNAVAAAYTKLGHVDTALDLIHTLLPVTNFTSDAKTNKHRDSFLLNSLNEDLVHCNIEDDPSKDRSSYNILIEGVLRGGNYALAIEHLKDMTRQGYYPNGRSLQRWNDNMNKSLDSFEEVPNNQ